MKTKLRLLLVLGLCPFVFGDAFGHPPYRHDPPEVSVEFLVGGRRLPQHSVRNGEAFVTVPRWGVEYEIRIANRERHDRVLFVIGVDGLSVVDGNRVSQQSGGYVLEAGGTARIRGWRRGLDHVAAFTFTGREDSYAAKTGRRSQIGQVRVWAIREQSHRPPPPDMLAEKEDSRPKAAGSARHAGGETGTGYGEELIDRVRTTRFHRSDSVRHLMFQYGLRRGYGYGVEEPYAPPPPGWRR